MRGIANAQFKIYALAQLRKCTPMYKDTTTIVYLYTYRYLNANVASVAIHCHITCTLMHDTDESHVGKRGRARTLVGAQTSALDRIFTTYFQAYFLRKESNPTRLSAVNRGKKDAGSGIGETPEVPITSDDERLAYSAHRLSLSEFEVVLLFRTGLWLS
jgi:hypothetical protein